jgi:hypothetical protein
MYDEKMPSSDESKNYKNLQNGKGPGEENIKTEIYEYAFQNVLLITKLLQHTCIKSNT